MAEDQPFWQHWYEGKDFSNDWFTFNIATWLRVLDPYTSRPMEILEVGSWEGRSAIAFLEMLPLSTITCVDRFGGEPPDPENHLLRDQLQKLEGRFDRNTAQYESRLTKIKGRSSAVLDGLAQEKRRFDIVYVDADHSRSAVLADSVMAWPLLRIGGVLIWDDLKFHLEWEPSERPADAIKMFCAMFGDSFRELHRGRQLIVRKEGEWPAKYRVHQAS
jgi:predicted O-methyltransferase YrrM